MRRRHLGRRDSEEQVDRALREHFAHFSPEEIDVTLVSGQTLRQTIREAKSKAKPGTHKLGSSCWKTLRIRFASPSDPCKKLVVDDPTPACARQPHRGAEDRERLEQQFGTDSRSSIGWRMQNTESARGRRLVQSNDAGDPLVLRPVATSSWLSDGSSRRIACRRSSPRKPRSSKITSTSRCAIVGLGCARRTPRWRSSGFAIGM